MSTRTPAREAVVLVGGQGTRLRPLTLTTPKPLLPVAGVPFLQHQFARLADAGIKRIVLATSYRAELFEAAFGDGSGFGLELVFVTEDEPRGTGGAIANVAAALESHDEDPVVVLNGDILSGHDLQRQIDDFSERAAEVSLHLVEVDDARAFGCVPTDAEGWVTHFLEKMPEPVSNQVNAGCYVFRRRLIDQIPTGRAVSVERETFPELLAKGARVRGYVETAYWLDLGTPASLLKGSRDLVTGQIRSSALPMPVGDSMALAGARVADDVALSDGTVIGVNCEVGQAAVVAGSLVMDDVVIGPGAYVVNSIVGRGAHIGAGARLIDAVIADGHATPARTAVSG